VNASSFSRTVSLGMDAAEGNLGSLTRAHTRLVEEAGLDAAGQFGTIVAASDWQPPPEGTLIDAQRLAARAVARLRAQHELILAAVVEQALEGTEIAWTITHPLSRALLAQAGRRTGERLGEAVQPLIRQTIEQAFTEGLSVNDTADRLRAAVREAAPWQARMLARTDLNSLANGGSVVAARLAGVPYKTWETAADEKVRPEHADADGQTVPVDQPFSVGGEELEYPGDPNGSDAMTANCRCTVGYADSLETLTAGGRTMHTVEDLTAAARKPQTWEATLIREGVRFEDGRMARKGSVSWRELPLSLMALTVTDEGHKGAQLAGRIEEIWRDGDRIRGRGVFAPSEFGREIARLVEDGTLRGVSVDFAVLEIEIQVPEQEIEADSQSVTLRPPQVDFVEAVIGMATVCPFPANEDAQIALTAAAATQALIVDDPDEQTALACAHSFDFWAGIAVGAHHETVVSSADFDLGDELDARIDQALDTLARTADLSTRLVDATKRADDAEALVESVRQENKQETLALIESLTARIAAGEQVSAALVKTIGELANRKPRAITVVRGEDGRPERYEETPV
jgi:hypothetical protein